MKAKVVLLLFMPFFIWCQTEFEQAEQLFRAGKLEQAKDIFLKIYHKNPKDYKTIEYLGDIEGHNKEWKKAREYYLKLRDTYPTNANYHFKYGGVLGMEMKEMNKLEAFSNIDELIISFETAIKYNPKHIEARWALIEIYIQLPGIMGGSKRKAQEYSDELLQISTVDGYLSKGHIAEHFEKYKDAEAYFIKAKEISKGSKNSYKRLINLYKKMNMPQKATKLQEEFNKKH